MAPCNSTRSVLASDAESLAARLEEQGVLRARKVKCVGKVLPFEVPVQVLCWSTTGGRQVPDLGRHERELASWWARDGGSFLSQSRLLPPATCHLPPCRGRPLAPPSPPVYSVPCPGPVAEGVARCREPNPDFEKNRPRQNPGFSPNKQTTAPPSPPQSIDEFGMARSPSPVPPRYTHLRPSALAAGGRPLAGWPRHSTPRHGPVHAWLAECRSANRDGQPTSPRASSTS